MYGVARGLDNLILTTYRPLTAPQATLLLLSSHLPISHTTPSPSYRHSTVGHTLTRNTTDTNTHKSSPLEDIVNLIARAMADVPLLVVSDNSSSERRITPAWSISTLKAKLEPVTGIPPSSQTISLKTSSQSIAIEAGDEDATYLSSFPLVAYAELHVRHYYLRS